MNATLEDLLNLKVSVATGSDAKGLTTRESPAAVTVITSEEIRRSGARDMVEILRLVPGFSFSSGTDTMGTIGLNLRGLRASEDRMLFQVNGMTLTEFGYGNVPMFSRFPIDLIKQIEIIRGPGSAIYGGFAELAVINVQLKEGKDLNGMQITGTYSRLAKDYGHQSVQLGLGQSEGDLSQSVLAMFSNANLSDRPYTAETGNSYDFNKQTGYSSRFINANIQNKEWTVRFLKADYAVLNQDQWLDSGLKNSYNGHFENTGALISHSSTFMDGRLKITPQFNYMSSTSFKSADESLRTTSTGYFSNDETERWRFQLNALYRIAEWADVVVGAETSHIKTRLDDYSFSTLVDDSYYFSNRALFSQFSFKVSNWDFTIGGRYEGTTASSKDALIPQFGVTSVMGNFHFKALYSQSFRTPTGVQYYGKQSHDLRPESATVAELEAGYRLTTKAILTANIFDNLVKDTISYDYLGVGNYYQNKGSIGSRGAELEYKYVDVWGEVAANATYIRETARGIPGQIVESDNQAILAIPREKFTLRGSYHLTEDLVISPSMSYEDELYQRSVAGGRAEKMSPVVIGNLYLVEANALNVADLEIGLGIYNLGDNRYFYPFVENNASSPQPNAIPGPGREYGAKLTYKF